MKKVTYILYVITILSVPIFFQATPLLERIVNNSDCMFSIIAHADVTACTWNNKQTVIGARVTFNGNFLLNQSDRSFALRPIAYVDPIDNTPFILVQDGQYVSDLVEKAYDQWRLRSKSRYKYLSAQDWLSSWVGGDIVIDFQTTQLSGYLVHLSRVVGYNNHFNNDQWINFSQGIFSKLVLTLEIIQNNKRGIKPVLKLHHGQGGICVDGAVQMI